MDQDEILLDAEERMEKAVQVLHGQLQGLRTGRATAGLVDSIRVDYYGSPTPLKQIANISIPEPQQILIRPFDASSLTQYREGHPVERYGSVAEFGRPRDSAQRACPLDRAPPAAQFGRVKELAEEARVAIRNVRRDANKHADQAQKDKTLTEDECEADEGPGAGPDQEVRGQGQRHGGAPKKKRS